MSFVVNVQKLNLLYVNRTENMFIIFLILNKKINLYQTESIDSDWNNIIYLRFKVNR